MVNETDEWESIPQPEVETESVDGEGDDRAHDRACAKMWAVSGNEFAPCERAVDVLPSGQYTIEHSSHRGLYFSKKPVNLDELLILPDSASEQVIQNVEDFWTKEQHFRELGFLWKRGILLWGPPGSGKTSTLQLISKKIVDGGGIAVYATQPDLDAKGLELLRRIEPTRPLVVMIEDIDAMTERMGESTILALLDGELQVDNVVFIATTNYPERLDKRLLNRPSRFDIVKEIGMPSAQARAVYLATKNPRLSGAEGADELSSWVDKTEGFSVAHLKELIVLVEVFSTPISVAVSRLENMINVKIESSGGRKIGFTQ